MESTNAKINRLQQTIRELTAMLDKQTKLAVKQKQINKRQLNNINELGKALVTKAKVEEDLRDEITELKTELNFIKQQFKS